MSEEAWVTIILAVIGAIQAITLAMLGRNSGKLDKLHEEVKRNGSGKEHEARSNGETPEDARSS